MGVSLIHNMGICLEDINMLLVTCFNQTEKQILSIVYTADEFSSLIHLYVRS